jgi:glycosyltransferase involved in cell wall biosynthesis
MKILLLPSSIHPFVEELRNQLRKNGVRTAVVYSQAPQAIRLGLIGDAFLFLGRVCARNPLMFFRLISTTFKTRFRLLRYLNHFMTYRMHLLRSFDLIHAFWSYPAGVWAVLIKAVTNTPVIISVLGYDIDERTLRYHSLRELSKFAIENADAVIVAAENHYLNLVQMGIDKRKIYFIPIGIDLAKFNTNIDGSFIRKKYGVSNDVVVAFGPRLKDLYGPVDFLRAAAIISKKVSNVSFILMGGGPSYHLKTLTRNWGLKAVFTGHIPYCEIPFYYAAADIFCTPSYAGQGVSTLEAMACGKPVVGYKVGTIRVIDGEDGFLVPKGDVEKLAEKLLILVREPDLRRIMGENARRRALQYDIATCTQRILGVYQRVLSISRRVKESNDEDADIS